jgi:hypothetical protein
VKSLIHGRDATDAQPTSATDRELTKEEEVTTVETSRRIRVDAPDAAAAFALEQRLAHLHPAAVGRGTDWCVELEDFDDRLDEITATVEHWLREIGIRSTRMHVDRDVTTVVAHHAEQTPLGSGYDSTDVLEHEP